MDLLCFCSVLCLLCLCVRLFICALWSPAGKRLTSWLSFVVAYCEFVTFPLVSYVRCVLDCIDSWSFHPYLLCWWHIPLCWKSHVTAQMSLSACVINLKVFSVIDRQFMKTNINRIFGQKEFTKCLHLKNKTIWTKIRSDERQTS